MRLHWVVTAFMVLWLASFASLAQVPAPKNHATQVVTAPAPVANPVVPAVPTVVAEPVVRPSDADVYKLLYEGQKEANRDLTQVMYFAISLVAAFLLAIAGSQALFNFRLRKSDIQNIEKTNAKQISESLEIAKKEIAQIVREGETENRSARDELSKYLSGRIDTVTGRIDTVSKAVDEISETVKPLEKLPFRVSTLEINFSTAEAHVWRLRGVESNALTGFVKAAKLLIENNQLGSLLFRLREIEDALTKVKDISVADYDKLAELMPKIPEQFHEERDRIVEIYEKLPVFEFGKKDDPREKTTWKYVRNAPAE